MKTKTVYVCQNCGAKAGKWMGKCSKCQQFNTFEEETEFVLPKGKSQEIIKKSITQDVIKLKDVESNNSHRIETSIGEFNRVLGGGIIRDSVTILSSPPGGGKSTLTLAVANDLAKKGYNVLYASGEESESQIKNRADRILDEIQPNLWIISGTCLNVVMEACKKTDCDFFVADSIQTFYLNEFLPSRAGNPTQTMECAAEIVRLCKNGKKPVSSIIIGQMNKNDELAGLRSLEHLVDTVLIMDGDSDEEIRSLTSTKNRFGSTGEMGFFRMTEEGLVSVSNPSEFFLTKREAQDAVSGSGVTVVREGTRPVIAEIESLVSRSFTPYPTRIGECLKREQLNTLISILEQRCKINLFDKNVVIKTTGGLKLKEQGSNLAVIMAIASSVFDKPISVTTAFIGDVGLTGEIKKVPSMEARIRELERMGFKEVYIAKDSVVKTKFKTIKVIDLKYAIEVIERVLK